MNLEKFNQIVEEINDNNYGYGNEILYIMANDSIDNIDKITILSGAMWIIGRSYAASPQRRNYGGKTKKTDEKDNPKYYKNGRDKDPVTRPIWPVLSSNDGREDFFTEISGYLLEKNTILKKLKEEKKRGFKYGGMFDENGNLINNSDDYMTLKEGISLVLKFNDELCKALEKFDHVPNNNKNRYEETVKCSNHISFCSKFLHFYLPDKVYIIDNYARAGASSLFRNNKYKAGFDFKDYRNDYFREDIYKCFANDEKYKKLSKSIKQFFSKTDKCQNNYKDEVEGIDTDENKDNIKDNNYVEHCVRSYMLGLYLNEYLSQKKISPKNQINYKKNYIVINPISRLTDAIFLNIKSEPSKEETEYIEEIKKVYDINI